MPGFRVRPASLRTSVHASKVWPRSILRVPRLRDPWIEQTIHGLLRKSRVHTLSSAIHGLSRSIFCAQHTYSDGSTEEKYFHYEFVPAENTSPVLGRYKMMFLESGHGLACSVVQQDSHVAGMSEMFFIYEDLRLSVVSKYNEGKLSRIACVREYSHGYPGKQWSMEVNPVSERSFAGNWEGTSVTLSASDLTISDPVPTRLQWGWEGYKVFYLPDGITVSCPSEVTDGGVSIVSNLMVTGTKMHQMLVKFNDHGLCTSVTLDILDLK